MQVSDYKLPKTVPRQVQEMLLEIVEILNNDGYQRRVYAQPPTSGSPGFIGEKRLVLSGAVLREYIYTASGWYKSDATATTGWSAV